MIQLCVIVFNFELFGVCRKGCRARAFSTTRPSKMKTCSPSSSALISSKRGEQTGCSAFQCLREFSFSLKLKCLMRWPLSTRPHLELFQSPVEKVLRDIVEHIMGLPGCFDAIVS